MVTRGDEDERALRVGDDLAQQVDERRDLLVLPVSDGHDMDFARDEERAAQIRRQLVVRVQTHHLRVTQARAGELQQHGRQRGGDQHGLAVSGELPANLVQLRGEAQLEQLIGLIVANVTVKNPPKVESNRI